MLTFTQQKLADFKDKLVNQRHDVTIMLRCACPKSPVNAIKEPQRTQRALLTARMSAT